MEKLIIMTLDYYKEAESAISTQILKAKPKIIHGVDKLLTKFNQLHYNNKKSWIAPCVVFFMVVCKI